MLDKIAVAEEKVYSFQEVKADFEQTNELFELFWYPKPIGKLRDFDLLVL